MRFAACEIDTSKKITGNPPFLRMAWIVGLIGALDGKTPWGHNHDDRYYTQGQLSTSGGSNVHWNNISNKPSFITSETDPWGFDSHWFSTSGSTVTLGIQRRNGSQAFASFNVPSTGGNFVSKSSGVQNIIYSENYFDGFTWFGQTVEVPYGLRMGGASWLFQNVTNSGSTPSISNDVIPVVINGVTRYILLKS